jgi:hypothetical protein
LATRPGNESRAESGWNSINRLFQTNKRGIMDLTTIAQSIATLLVPYMKKAGEEFAGEFGTAVFKKME